MLPVALLPVTERGAPDFNCSGVERVQKSRRSVVEAVSEEAMKVHQVQVEAHYSVKFLAEWWGLSESTVLRMFQDAPGVFRVGKQSKNGRRARCELRIPLSVAMRIYEEHTR